MFNSTVLYLDNMVSESGRKTKLFLLIIIDAVAVCANFIFLLAVYCRKPIRKQSRTFIYFSYVSLTNLATGLFVIPFPIIAFASKRWILGEIVCYTNAFMTFFCLISCINSITVLSIHKYVSIVWPVKSQTKHKQIIYRIGFAFVVSFAITLVPFIESSVYFNRNTGLCAVYFTERKVFYTLFVVCVAYFIPTIANVFMYIRIFGALQQHGKRLRRNSFSNHISIKSQRETLNTLYMVFVSFIVAWAPFFVYALLFLTNGDISSTFLVVAYFCGFINSVTNPVIFIFRNLRVRSSWKSIFRKRKAPKLSLISTLSKYDFTTTVEQNSLGTGEINDGYDEHTDHFLEQENGANTARIDFINYSSIELFSTANLDSEVDSTSKLSERKISTFTQKYKTSAM